MYLTSAHRFRDPRTPCSRLSSHGPAAASAHHPRLPPTSSCLRIYTQPHSIETTKNLRSSRYVLSIIQHRASILPRLRPVLGTQQGEHGLRMVVMMCRFFSRFPSPRGVCRTSTLPGDLADQFSRAQGRFPNYGCSAR